ncbi:unnamed protein product [Paramecium octaurelia]|uniref:Uncharacterized protein n=1 Tax=Paramecium octaurelia TaxID=43137 RepID=A0A8S1YNC5_PAROT|nr:unnamed protein product [Paramecium octaurelia]
MGVKFRLEIGLSDGFQCDSQVIYMGGYKNGQKIGRWNILFRGQYCAILDKCKLQYKLIYIGGGFL